jgi:hypothetical protein
MVAHNYDDILGEEENDYEGLDEEVVSGILSLTDIYHTWTFCGKTPGKNKMVQLKRGLLRVQDLKNR